MPSISVLVKQLSRDFPSITFTLSSSECAWNPDAKEVLYSTTALPAELLHEVGHALLGHSTYKRDIELLRIEREAWEYAITQLAPHYAVTISEDIVESALDTYREWLHKRSLCPNCGLNGIQKSDTTYQCIHCHQKWSVNEARSCRLRRTRIPTK